MDFNDINLTFGSEFEFCPVLYLLCDVGSALNFSVSQCPLLKQGQSQQTVVTNNIC